MVQTETVGGYQCSAIVNNWIGRVCLFVCNRGDIICTVSTAAKKEALPIKK